MGLQTYDPAPNHLFIKIGNVSKRLIDSVLLCDQANVNNRLRTQRAAGKRHLSPHLLLAEKAVYDG